MNFVSNLANHSVQTRLGAELGTAALGEKKKTWLETWNRTRYSAELGNELDSKLESFELGVPLESRLGTELDTLIGKILSW